MYWFLRVFLYCFVRIDRSYRFQDIFNGCPARALEHTSKHAGRGLSDQDTLIDHNDITPLGRR